MDTGLFNLLTRSQVYVEGVKNWFAIDLNRYLKLLATSIKDFFAKLGIKGMGDLNKRQLTELLKRVDKRSNEVLSQFSSEFIAELRRFSQATMTTQRAGFAVALPKVNLSGLSISSIWSAAKDRIIPAFGKNVKDTAVDLVNSAREKIRARINVGFADNETVEATTQAVVNLRPQDEPSTLKQVGSGMRSFVSTALQHAASTVSDFIGQEVFDCYQWVSVIDSRTSPICRERDGNVYRYGAGPMPPAHPNCRSHTVPVACGEGSSKTPSYYDWLLRQPASFLSDAVSKGFAQKVAAGTVSAKDVPDVLTYPAISLDEYELKAAKLTE